MPETLTELCKRLEHFETPEWAAKAILNKEVLTRYVIDPCCGSGILTNVADKAGYDVYSIDIHDWGFPGTQVQDFLELERDFITENGEKIADFTFFMNPPFKLAVNFVEKAFELGARKIVCFQRFAWWEAKSRKVFWQKYPPNRVYICGDRAASWRHDIRGWDRISSTPTAHAWFVWEKGHPPATLIGHIYKGDAA